MASISSVNESLLVSRIEGREAVRRALRLYVGRGRRYSVKQLSNGTGVPDRKIEAAMCEPDNPDFRPLAHEDLMSISRFLGAGFTNEWIAPAHQGAFDLPDEGLPRPGDVVAESAEDHAQLANAARDGEFCERDQPKLRVIGEEQIERGMKLVAMASKPARKARAA